MGCSSMGKMHISYFTLKVKERLNRKNSFVNAVSIVLPGLASFLDCHLESNFRLDCTGPTTYHTLQPEVTRLPMTYHSSLLQTNTNVIPDVDIVKLLLSTITKSNNHISTENYTDEHGLC